MRTALAQLGMVRDTPTYQNISEGKITCCNPSRDCLNFLHAAWKHAG